MDFKLRQQVNADSSIDVTLFGIFTDVKFPQYENKLLEITGRFDTLRKDSKVIAALCDDIKEIEHTVDDIFESYMSNLFEKEPDAKELIKKKNIAQALENTSDVAKVVSSKIRGIVVKNS